MTYMCGIMEEKHNPGAGMENVKRNANAVVMNS